MLALLLAAAVTLPPSGPRPQSVEISTRAARRDPPRRRDDAATARAQQALQGKLEWSGLFDGAAKGSLPVAPAAHAPFAFASAYSPHDMLAPAKRDAFLREAAYWEGQFHQPGIAYNAASGLTYDGHDLDARGRPLPGGPRAFTAPSKESIHVSLLAKAVAGDPYARILVSPEDPARAKAKALELLSRKMSSYEKFNRQYPGFGGYQPWVDVGDDGMSPKADWKDRVPALDSGELAWSLMAAVEALRAGGQPKLAARYQAQLDLMARNADRLFFDPKTGKIRAEAAIPDPKKPPERQTYRAPGPGYHLDDPFEGELFVLFWSLYGRAPGAAVREVWASKQPAPLDFKTGRGVVTVRRGWAFSSHEEWNLLLAPYLDDPFIRRVMRNNQRLRTIYSSERGVAAMFAAAHSPETPPSYRNYGIPGAGTEASRDDAAVPYGAFPVVLTDPAVGLAWYLAMLKHPGMQGPLGGGESGEIGGPGVAPVATWDAKETVALAAMGGTGDLARAYLRRTRREARFRALIGESYRRGFDGHPLQGEGLPLAMPPMP